MTFDRVVFATGKNDWETPAKLFASLDEEFHFNLDVAASADNAKCTEWLGPGSSFPDALVVAWHEFVWLHVAWCNPPYSRNLQKLFIAKAARERLRGVTTVMLLPARTDTLVFHEHIWDRERHQPREGVQMRLIKGRLKFVGAPAGAPFPSMVVVFRGTEAQSAEGN